MLVLLTACMWVFLPHNHNLTGRAKKAVSDLAIFVATMGRKAGQRHFIPYPSLGQANGKL
jgi:hypothetical protein